eukprot:m.78672 g.78672  ORF g.78672 m.78672 type:complete len:264 (-) comp14593_c0_seq5:143-934(-)
MIEDSTCSCCLNVTLAAWHLPPLLCIAAENGRVEVGRIFYFSVPPFAYVGLANNVNKHCRPDKPAWLRVAIEKPFGSDLTSAQEMASDLSAILAEDELFRVDHYLGKRGVKQIIPFREANRKLWDNAVTAEHVKRVDIAMKETEDCKSRTGFYDEYGVVRDTMQNHLTEILAFVGMDLPATDQDFHTAKSAFLASVLPAQATHTLLGQYHHYQEHFADDHPDSNEKPNTPTFGASVLHTDLPRLKNVPFVILSGKQVCSTSSA